MCQKLKFVIGFLVILLAGCSQKSPEEHLELAKEYLQKDDRNAAIIELKNVLSKDDTNTQARLTLSQVYMSLGLAEGAEKEARIALNAGADPNIAVPLMAKATKFLENNEDTIILVNSHKNLNQSALVESKFFQALAYYKLDEVEQANDTIEQIIKLDPSSKYSRLSQAYLSIDNNDFDKANDIISSILEDENNFVEALYLKGILNFSNNSYEDATNAFQAYEKIVSGDVRVKIFLAHIFLKKNDFQNAESYLKKINKTHDKLPIVNQLMGVWHFKKQEFEQAKSYIDYAIQNNLDSTSNRLIAGVSAYNLKNYEQAYVNLHNIRGALEKGHPALQVLASAELKLGYINQAENTLQQLQNLGLADENLLTSAGLMYASRGDTLKAREMLELSKQTKVDENPELQVRKALLKLSLEDLSGIDELEKIVEQTPDVSLAKISLAKVYLNTQQYDKALELATAFQNSESLSEQLSGWILAGEIHNINKDKELANEAFNKASEISPDNPASLMHYGKQALIDEKYQDAAELSNKVLLKSPNHFPALALYFAAQKELNNPELAITKISESYQQNSTDLSYALFYASALREVNKHKLAAKTLDQFRIVDGGTTPDAYWNMLVDSLERSWNLDDTIKTIDEWIFYKPKNVTPLLKKISFYDRRQQYSSALLATEQARRAIPDNSTFKMLEINFLILSKNLAKAQSLIDGLSSELRDTAQVNVLQGKVHFEQGHHEKAVKPLLYGYSKFSTSNNAKLVFDNYVALKQQDQAVSFIMKHLDKNPQDISALAALGDYQINFSMSDARSTYLKIIDLDKDNINALNNVAWVNIQLGNKEEALLYSEKAVHLRPDIPQILDTHGEALLINGKISEAQKVLKEALKLSPNSKSIVENLRKAQVAGSD